MTSLDRRAKALLLAGVLAFLAVALAPVAWMLATCLMAEPAAPFAPFADVLTSPRQWALFQGSLILAAFTATGAMAMGAALAYVVTRIAVPGRGTWTALLMVPLVVPPYVFALAWLDLLGRRGPLNAALTELLGTDAPPLNVYSLAGAAFVMSLCHFPIVFLTTRAALNSIDARFEEAGRLFAGDRRTFFGITLRQAAPGCLAGGLLVFVLALAEFGVPSLLCVPVYTIEVFTKFSAFYDTPGATATAAPLLCVSLLALYLCNRCMRGARRPAWSGQARHVPPGRGRIRRGLGLAACAVAVAGSVVAPVAVLMKRAGALGTYVRAIETAWDELIHSLVTAALAATAMALLALVVAYAARRLRPRAGNALDWAALASLAVPGTVLGVGLIGLWNRPGLLGLVYETVGILLLAYVARFFAVAHKGLETAIDRLDPGLEEAAAASGVSWWRGFIWIVAPLLAPAFAAVWLLTFILCLGELNAAVLVCPPGYTTLSVRIFTLMHYGMNELVAALAVILVMCTVLPLVLLGPLARRIATPRKASAP
ncbi:MAG: iron ABC transporter permease [Candidatus Hydrogenedentes bacterium]|nr:iron ABC transporter permease [Candidatus Hydrogenedentota bacterium]